MHVTHTLVSNAVGVRLALTAVLAATGADRDGRSLCAALLDAGAELLRTAPPAALAATLGELDAVDQLAAKAELTAACVRCCACPRGRGLRSMAA
jgi:hypothetical protein